MTTEVQIIKKFLICFFDRKYSSMSSPSANILLKNKCEHLIAQPHLRQCYKYVNWLFAPEKVHKIKPFLALNNFSNYEYQSAIILVKYFNTFCEKFQFPKFCVILFCKF